MKKMKLSHKTVLSLVLSAVEDYSYMKDGEKKSGKQFKFAMDFTKHKKK